MSEQRLTEQQVDDEGLTDWRILFESLRTRFLTGDFARGLGLLGAIGSAAEEAGHHPDLDLRPTHLNARLHSHDVFGVTSRDVDLARRISALAAAAGVPADPSVVSVVELALDSVDHAAIRPFWKAVLGLGDNPDTDRELRDDDGDLPTLWFQPTDPHPEPRQRFHLDVRVPPEVAEGRIAAALAAGGSPVSDARAPAFTVLADVEGNKACVTTWRGRSRPSVQPLPPS